MTKAQTLYIITQNHSDTPLLPSQQLGPRSMREMAWSHQLGICLLMSRHDCFSLFLPQFCSSYKDQTRIHLLPRHSHTSQQKFSLLLLCPWQCFSWCSIESLVRAWVSMGLPSCEPVNRLGTVCMIRHFVMHCAYHLARAQETLAEGNWITTW